MSVIVVLAPLCSLILSVAAVLSIRRFGKSNRLGCLLGIVLFFLLTYPSCRAIEHLTTTTLIDVDPKIGEARLEQFGLPPNTTSDFCFRFSFVGVRVMADFQMPEKHYLAWTESQGWQPKPFETKAGQSWATLPDGTSIDPEVYPVRQYDKLTPLIVRRGWYAGVVDPQNTDDTVTAIYDLDAGRVYFQHTTY